MVSFESGGQKYELAFRMAALKAYQRATGETIVQGFEAFEATPGDMVRASALFRAACTPVVSEDEADALIDAIGIGPAFALLLEAVKESSLGTPDPNSGAQPDQA